MTDDRNVTWRFKVDGAAQTAQQVKTVDKSMANMDQRSRMVATRFTGVASASSALGSVLGQLTPQVGGLASALGTAGGATSGLVTALGGAGGLIAGGLIAVAAIAIRHITNLRKEHAAAAKAATSQKAQTEELTKALQRYHALRDEAYKSFRLATGKASEIEYEEAIWEAASRRNKLLQQTIPNIRNHWKGTEKQVEKYKELTAQLRAANEDIVKYTRSLNQLRKAEGGKGGAGGAGGAAGGRGARATGPRGESLDALMGRAFQPSIYDQMIDDINARQERAQEESLDRQIQAWDNFLKDKFAMLNLYENEAGDLREKREKAEKKYEDNLKNAAASYGQYSGEVMISSIQAMAKGKEMSAALVLEQFGDQMVAEGTRRLWQAAGMAFIPWEAPFAGSLAGIAAAEIAAGIAMGAAGAQMAPQPGGSGPARPEPATGRNDGGGDGGGTITINFNTLASTRETQQALVQTLNDAAQTQGKSGIPVWGK